MNMRAAVYARYSSDNQSEASIDAQLRAIENYCKQNDILIVKTYVDKALTATSDKRPEFQQMIKDSALDLFDAVVVHKLDRFSRDRYDSATYKRKLKKNGVRIISVLENLDGSPESVILESLLEGMAEYYSKNLAREVAKGMKETSLKCQHTGGKPPLGFDVDPTSKKLIINEDEAPIIRLIFDLSSKGYSYGKILDRLDKEGYRTKLGGKFGKNNIYSILTNEKYKGTYTYNVRPNKGVKKNDEEIIRVEGGCPAIVSNEVFDRLQDKYKKYRNQNARNKAKVLYLLSGLIECGCCGHSYVGYSTSTGRKNIKNENDSPIFYYFYRCCCKTNKKNCDNRNVRKDEIEDFILTELESKLFNDTAYLVDRLNDYLKNKSNSNVDERATIEKSIKEIDVKISNIIIAISNGMFNDTLKNELTRLEDMKSELSIKLNQAVSNKNLMFVDEQVIKEILKRFRSFVKERNLPEIKNFIDSFVKKVVIHQDKTVLYFTVPSSDNFVIEHTVSLDATKK